MSGGMGCMDGMDGMSGMEVLERVKASVPETEVMVITAHGTIEKVVEAMKLIG